MTGFQCITVCFSLTEDLHKSSALSSLSESCKRKLCISVVIQIQCLLHILVFFENQSLTLCSGNILRDGLNFTEI